MARNIVFFDIDGTILNENHEIALSTKRAIQELQDAGVYTAIATGRAPSTFTWIREELGIRSYVSINGQYVVFEDEVIYDQPLDTVELEAFASMAASLHHPIVYMHSHGMSASMEHQLIHDGLRTCNLEHPPICAMGYREAAVYQGVLFCDDEATIPFAERFQNMQFYRWHSLATDFLQKDGSKAVGIRKLLERTGMSQEHCYAFGDGVNDIEMLQFAGTGVAMGNASQEVKRHADLVTASHTEDGIWKGLRTVGLL
ncbi:Cof-type HAD-IIB family hydrolase [Paenibacillus sp. MER TA 81-3]|uniref:Cof-type HAD-IIB family hydrolase n=1 Tax=Paenibacillus sp. MER TA 81-3 TaxID=2939573 RepID=UPI002041B148|nr:Cof-type HAD-IIB family hydrolase [Paenibacillus sp. MER TA 81-3]MCM3340429.1 Cof-type HAD-IIB family hydrolase [Paenibacillus sp. MER TA 81-3]